MKHIVAIPELARRLGVDLDLAHVIAREADALSWTEEMGPCISRNMWGPIMRAARRVRS
jgi:hypothetical protein